MRDFNKKELKKLHMPDKNSNGEQNGQITIIGGSKLFHGAPILALMAASRIVDMVFFASPEKSVGYVAENIKSKVASFIWVPWEEVEEYIKKSDAILIGPGFMRYSSENDKHKYDSNYCDEECRTTREITKRFLIKFPEKKWVIDAGSLQVMEPKWIPENIVVTPNKKEFEMLFGSNGKELEEKRAEFVSDMAIKYKCTIVLKGPQTIVASPNDAVIVNGGNAGMTKGGTGDVLAGLTVALLAKNEPFLAAAAASFIQKKTAEDLYKHKNIFFSADDLAKAIPEVFNTLLTE